MAKLSRTKGQRVINKALRSLSSNGAKYSMYINDETFRKKLFMWGLSQATMCNIDKHHL